MAALKKSGLVARTPLDFLTRFHQKSPQNSSQSKANHLRRESQHQGKAPAEVLPIEGSLREKCIGCIRLPCSIRRIGHDHNYRMLLHVEGPRIQVELEFPNPELAIGKNGLPRNTYWPSDQLNHKGSDRNGWAAHGEQHIHSRAKGGQDQPNRPGSNRVGRSFLIILEIFPLVVFTLIMESATNIANSSPDFGVGRVLFECTNEAHFMLKIVGMRGLVDILKSVGGKVRIPSMFSL